MPSSKCERRQGLLQMVRERLNFAAIGVGVGCLAPCLNANVDDRPSIRGWRRGQAGRPQDSEMNGHASLDMPAPRSARSSKNQSPPSLRNSAGGYEDPPHRCRNQQTVRATQSRHHREVATRPHAEKPAEFNKKLDGGVEGVWGELITQV